jgi:hypothetical protein
VQWFADGQLVEGTSPGATTLPVTPDLVDRTITASVTATRTGYDPVVATAAPTEPVAPGTFRITTPPTLLGTPKLGETLTVRADGYQPSDAALDYQWLRDGEPVPDATGPSYQLTNLDLGAHISARVTLRRAGYTTASVDSPPTARVRTDPRIEVRLERARNRIKVLVSVTAAGVEAVTGPIVVRIAGVVQEVELRADGTARITFTDLRPGERTLRVRYAGSDSVGAASYSRQVRVR